MLSQNSPGSTTPFPQVFKAQFDQEPIDPQHLWVDSTQQFESHPSPFKGNWPVSTASLSQTSPVFQIPFPHVRGVQIDCCPELPEHQKSDSIVQTSEQPSPLFEKLGAVETSLSHSSPEFINPFPQVFKIQTDWDPIAPLHLWVDSTVHEELHPSPEAGLALAPLLSLSQASPVSRIPFPQFKF